MSDPYRFKPTHRWAPIRFTLPALLGFLFLLTGCFARQQIVYQEMMSPKAEAAPRTLAILPFQDQTGNPQLASLVRVSFYGHISPRRFKDTELAAVDHVLESMTGDPTKSLTPKMLRELGDRLGCDAVVTGRITQFERLFMGVYSQLSIRAEIEILGTRDGRRLWFDSQITRLHDGGLPLTPLGIPLSGARSGWNLRGSQITRAVDELTRTLTERIPGPDAPPARVTTDLFELQVGAYLDHRRALDQRDNLLSRGFPAAVTSELHKNTIWHRVMVGPYSDESEALRIRQQLEDQFAIRPFLRRRIL